MPTSAVLAEGLSKGRRDAAMGKWSKEVMVYGRGMGGFATALSDCRYFDDADLIERRFRLMLHQGGAALP